MSVFLRGKHSFDFFSDAFLGTQVGWCKKCSRKRTMKADTYTLIHHDTVGTKGSNPFGNRLSHN